MKQSIILLLAIFALVTFGVTSCKQEKEQSVTNTTVVPDGGGQENTRTVVIRDGSKEDSSLVSIEFPTYPNASLNVSITEQLNEQLGGLYEGDYADCDSFARFYSAYFIKEMKKMRDEFEDFEPEMPFCRELTITKGYETDAWVTFDLQTYEFSGGAHGGGVAYGITFRKSDGRHVGRDMLAPERDPMEWNNLLKQGLMKYFEAKDETELENCLIDVSLYDIPMPAYGVSFVPDGLSFVYQQYEIAPYAAGRPNFTIPYDKLRPFLNITGRRLLDLCK